VLFSQPELAAWMSDSFECAWESVREVPRVTFDFGGERVVRRTLHGNVVTWVCDAEGRALDAIGGLYEPAPYRARLEQAALLAKLLARAQGDDARAATFHDWHARQAERTSSGRAPLVVGPPPVDAYSKIALERPLELAIVDPEARTLRLGSKAGAELAVEGSIRVSLASSGNAWAGAESVGLSKGSMERPLERAVAPRPSGETLAAPGVRADKGLLAQDTSLGETRFRPVLHRLLEERGMVPYGQLTKSAYREALHVDLDDPWLGLGELLFRDYPFDV
jgi:hypothetical protein